MKLFYSKKILYALFIIVCSCSKDAIEIGTTIQYGKIQDRKLEYIFKKFDRSNKVEDLFNFMYFAGDTLCFGLKLNKGYNKDKIQAVFINPSNGKSFPVDRLDFDDEHITGFSLIGTIMQNFYTTDLNNNIPNDKYCCSDIPFIIKVQTADKIIEKKSSFKIIYKD